MALLSHALKVKRNCHSVHEVHLEMLGPSLLSDPSDESVDGGAKRLASSSFFSGGAMRLAFCLAPPLSSSNGEISAPPLSSSNGVLVSSFFPFWLRSKLQARLQLETYVQPRRNKFPSSHVLAAQALAFSPSFHSSFVAL